jgi:6-pyruvoyltetrahydropterin/6-carboxytetrahydropterin synthase
MYELKVITHFSAAHQLREFRGSCEQLHGHNWKIEVCVSSEVLDASGVAIDFRELKEHVHAVIDTLDHKFLNDITPFDKQNPSSENIARYVAEKLAPLIERTKRSGVKISRVTAWESDTACATYYPPNPPPNFGYIH